MSELQAHHCMTPEQRTWLKRSVNFMTANKLSLQDLSQLIGIELLIQVCYKMLILSPNFQGNKCSFPLRPPMVLTNCTTG